MFQISFQQSLQLWTSSSDSKQVISRTFHVLEHEIVTRSQIKASIPRVHYSAPKSICLANNLFIFIEYAAVVRAE
jgi:hypothetical protein